MSSAEGHQVWSTCPMSRGWGRWACPAWRGVGFGVTNSSPLQCLWGGYQGDGGRFFTVVHSGQAMSINCKKGSNWIWGKIFFHNKSSRNQAGEQVAQRGCAISILGGLQYLTGQRSVWATWSDLLADPSLSRSFDKRPSKVPSNLNDPMILKLPTCSTKHRFKNWTIWSRLTHSGANHTIPFHLL